MIEGHKECWGDGNDTGGRKETAITKSPANAQSRKVIRNKTK